MAAALEEKESGEGEGDESPMVEQCQPRQESTATEKAHAPSPQAEKRGDSCQLGVDSPGTKFGV